MISQTNIEHVLFSTPERLDRRTRLHELLDTRWSPRSFSEKSIEPSKILSLFEAARWSPSSANEQPWTFIAATKEDEDTYAALLGTLSERNRIWAARAPMLILAVAQLAYAKNGKTNRHAWYDVGQSIAHLTVQASALGIAVHQIGGFDAERARTLFSIPEGYEPVVVLAVGYVESADQLPADLRQRELAPRSRKPLEEIVFTGRWGDASPHAISENPALNNVPSKN